ncbi:hypothetical protein MPSEU_000480300 [Mayamaea pseudoterrestris]|nr:hypothetical protein MPSEU_000480300 [Mayamaea pseudoterrestris]
MSQSPELIPIMNAHSPSNNVKTTTLSQDSTTDMFMESNSTEAGRMSREEEESIELARQLMAEEAMASYHQHVNSLRLASDSGQMSPEEAAIWQIAMQEEERDLVVAEEAANELSYDALLQLSERIGDVRTERWTMISTKEIEKLTICTFDSTTCTAADDSQHKCLVCQSEYAEGEKLRRLPCSHTFHQGCVDVWLSSKDVCPYCRMSIVS